MRRTLIAWLGLTMAFGLAAPASAAQSAAQQSTQGRDRTVDYHQWTNFFGGQAEGTSAFGGLRIARPTGTVSHTEPALHTTKTYDVAQWTSPVQRSKVDADELIASWNADTPQGTFIEVQMRATTTAGKSSGWYTMGRWAFGDEDIQRTSVDGQKDAVGSISTDTFLAADDVHVNRYQLRAKLFRQHGTSATPTVRLLGAMTSAVPQRESVPASRPGIARGVELPVPHYAQNIHKGDFPQYGGGGESWCSPTSTEMVTEYWRKHPTEEQMSWIPKDMPDRTVDFAARYTYDYAYEGTGNWPFNTAYAAHFGLAGHITRLTSLNDLERYIARGIPVITSQSFEKGEMAGADYTTDGHLMVVVGFTRNGDVVVNDPATNADNTVRNVYPRHAFETVWLRTKRTLHDGSTAGGSGGVAYVITPRGWPTP